MLVLRWEHFLKIEYKWYSTVIVHINRKGLPFLLYGSLNHIFHLYRSWRNKQPKAKLSQIEFITFPLHFAAKQCITVNATFGPICSQLKIWAIQQAPYLPHAVICSFSGVVFCKLDWICCFFISAVIASGQATTVPPMQLFIAVFCPVWMQ